MVGFVLVAAIFAVQVHVLFVLGVVVLVVW